MAHPRVAEWARSLDKKAQPTVEDDTEIDPDEEEYWDEFHQS